MAISSIKELPVIQFWQKRMEKQLSDERLCYHSTSPVWQNSLLCHVSLLGLFSVWQAPKFLFYIKRLALHTPLDKLLLANKLVAHLHRKDEVFQGVSSDSRWFVARSTGRRMWRPRRAAIPCKQTACTETIPQHNKVSFNVQLDFSIPQLQFRCQCLCSSGFRPLTEVCIGSQIHMI